MERLAASAGARREQAFTAATGPPDLRGSRPHFPAPATPTPPVRVPPCRSPLIVYAGLAESPDAMGVVMGVSVQCKASNRAFSMR